MPYLQLNDTQFPLLEGETRVGRGDGADLRLPRGSETSLGVYAVITLASDSSATVRRESPTASIFVNTVPLGPNSMPLLHGDRLTIDGVIGLFGDEKQAGLTAQMVIPLPEAGPLTVSGGPGVRSGGRLVSHTDGREYLVGDEGVTIGREAGCDIVIAAGEVSRRHARVELHPEGYAIVDLSTNGLLVNGSRIVGSRTLSSGDTIRIGPEEFRFAGDVTPRPVVPQTLKATPPMGVRTAPAAPIPAAPPAPRSEEATGVEQPMPRTAAAVAPTAKASPAPAQATPRPKKTALASLEIINEGPSKGTKFTIDSPLTHVGRGAHNEVQIADESVSDTHAKIQRRDEGWVVVDMDSTNGTYVAGQRVNGEEPLPPNTDIRFGGVKVAFRTLGSARDESGGTRVIVGYKGPPPDARRLGAKTPVPPGAAVPETSDDAATSGGMPRFLLGSVLVLALVVVYFIVRTLWK